MARESALRNRVHAPEEWEELESGGAGGFEDSRAVYRLPDGSEYHWESRRHRKGRGPRRASGQAAQTDRSREAGKRNPWLGGFAPHRISWWVAVAFIVGSALFTLGATSSLLAPLFGEEAAKVVADLSYFVGALLFTGGIYLQVLEGINSSDNIGLQRPYNTPREFRWFAWQPRRLGFMAPFLLLIGSLFFNVETTLVILSSLGLATLPVAIGLTSLAGSVLFLVPSYLQMIEVCHRYLCWRPREISWWVTVFFVLGSVGFVVGSVFGFNVPGLSSPAESEITKWGFLQGSVFFLAGSYLMLPEMFSE